MRCIKNVNIFLIVGLAALAIPIAAKVDLSKPTVVSELQVSPANHSGNDHYNAGKAAVGKGLAKPQDYWDRRREYWERRLESDLDESDENMDDESADKNDKADSKDSKESDDPEEEAIERRREYWRQRLDRDW